MTAATGSGAWTAALRPTLATSYHRTTLLLPDQPTRVTVDVDVAVSTPDGDSRALDGLAVVETKGGHSPTEVDRMLWALGHRPTRISKYGTGLALLRPELPANRWHRTLARIHREPA